MPCFHEYGRSQAEKRSLVYILELNTVHVLRDSSFTCIAIRIGRVTYRMVFLRNEVQVWLPVNRRSAGMAGLTCRNTARHQSLQPDNQCTSRCLVWHRYIWLMTSTLSPTAAAAFSDQQPTGLVSSHVHTTPLMTGVSLLPVRECRTIYRHSCDRTSAADNSNDN